MGKRTPAAGLKKKKASSTIAKAPAEPAAGKWAKGSDLEALIDRLEGGFLSRDREMFDGAVDGLCKALGLRLRRA